GFPARNLVLPERKLMFLRWNLMLLTQNLMLLARNLGFRGRTLGLQGRIPPHLFAETYMSKYHRTVRQLQHEPKTIEEDLQMLRKHMPRTSFAGAVVVAIGLS